jgi:hypothetical protein
MKDDVRRLARQAGWSADQYREVAVEQQQDEAARVWPLIAAVNRCLAAPAATVVAPAAPPPQPRVVVVSEPAPVAAPRVLSTRTITQWRA